tara:strand:- start:84 stop:962 length:879 start_codon:yes stop_codon:yes gene_type:complete
MAIAIQKIYGGFGNQAFQISAGVMICKKLNINTLFIDLNSLSKYSKKRELTINQVFELNNIKVNVLKNKSIFLSMISNLRIPKFLNALNLSLPFIAISDNNFLDILNSRRRKFQLIPLVLIDGYFNKSNDQNSFHKLTRELINIKKLSDSKLKKNNSTCIHIRGNDFLDQKKSRDWILEFYIKVINFLIEEYNIKKIDVITDDIKYSSYLIEKILRNLSLKIVIDIQKNTKFIDDIIRFSNYEFHILSDSTFSIISSSICENNSIKRFAPKMFDNKYERNFSLKNEMNLYEK